jgi:hypothetical protein
MTASHTPPGADKAAELAACARGRAAQPDGRDLLAGRCGAPGWHLQALTGEQHR